MGVYLQYAKQVRQTYIGPEALTPVPKHQDQPYFAIKDAWENLQLTQVLTAMQEANVIFPLTPTDLHQALIQAEALPLTDWGKIRAREATLISYANLTLAL